MDEKLINTFLIAVAYPTMILAVGWTFAILLGKSGKYRTNSSKKSFDPDKIGVDHRVRK